MQLGKHAVHANRHPRAALTLQRLLEQVGADDVAAEEVRVVEGHAVAQLAVGWRLQRAARGTAGERQCLRSGMSSWLRRASIPLLANRCEQLGRHGQQESCRQKHPPQLTMNMRRLSGTSWTAFTNSTPVWQSRRSLSWSATVSSGGGAVPPAAASVCCPAVRSAGCSRRSSCNEMLALHGARRERVQGPSGGQAGWVN